MQETSVGLHVVARSYFVTYPKEVNVILLRTPGVRRSDDEKAGEIFTSLVLEFEHGIFFFQPKAKILQTD